MVFNPLSAKQPLQLYSLYHDRISLRQQADTRAAFLFIRNSSVYRPRLEKEVARALYPMTLNTACYLIIEQFFARTAIKPRPFVWTDEFAQTRSSPQKVMFICLHQRGLHLTHAFQQAGISAIRPVRSPDYFHQHLAERGISTSEQRPIPSDALSLIKSLKLLKDYNSLLIAVDYAVPGQARRMIHPNSLEVAARRGIATCFIFPQSRDDGTVAIITSRVKVRTDVDEATQELQQFFAAIDPRFGGYEIRKRLPHSAMN